MLYVCIPVHNEAATIGVLLWRIRTVLQEYAREYEVVVYDDGSTDETAEVLEPYRKVLPLTVLRGERRLGTAGAVDALCRHVVALTRYPRRDGAVLMQGDFTDRPEDLLELARHFEGGADLVVGRRPASESQPAGERRLRQWAPRVLRLFVRVADADDLLAGFRLVRVSVLRDAARARGGAPLAAGAGWTAVVDFALAVLPYARRVERIELPGRYDLRPRASRLDWWSELRQLTAYAWRARGRRVLAGDRVGDRPERADRPERVERPEPLPEPAPALRAEARALLERGERPARATRPLEAEAGRGPRRRRTPGDEAPGAQRERPEVRTAERAPRRPPPDEQRPTARGARWSEEDEGVESMRPRPGRSERPSRADRPERPALATGGETPGAPTDAPTAAAGPAAEAPPRAKRRRKRDRSPAGAPAPALAEVGSAGTSSAEDAPALVTAERAVEVDLDAPVGDGGADVAEGGAARKRSRRRRRRGSRADAGPGGTGGAGGDTPAGDEASGEHRDGPAVEGGSAGRRHEVAEHDAGGRGADVDAPEADAHEADAHEADAHEAEAPEAGEPAGGDLEGRARRRRRRRGRGERAGGDGSSAAAAGTDVGDGVGVREVGEREPVGRALPPDSAPD